MWRPGYFRLWGRTSRTCRGGGLAVRAERDGVDVRTVAGQNGGGLAGGYIPQRHRPVLGTGGQGLAVQAECHAAPGVGAGAATSVGEGGGGLAGGDVPYLRGCTTS